MLLAIGWGGIAATSLLIGYGLALRGLSNRTIGLVMAIGGGALISAIAYELVPESLIEGWGMAVAFALGGMVNIAFLASVFISNLPEGVAGTVNLEAAGHSRRTIFWMWLSLVLISALSAGLGYAAVTWLPIIDGLLAQSFAAGAMLTMLSDAMLPEPFEHGGKLAGLFTAGGFLVAAILAVLQ